MRPKTLQHEVRPLSINQGDWAYDRLVNSFSQRLKLLLSGMKSVVRMVRCFVCEVISVSLVWAVDVTDKLAF